MRIQFILDIKLKIFNKLILNYLKTLNFFIWNYKNTLFPSFIWLFKQKFLFIIL
jgi:hypothetical protein